MIWFLDRPGERLQCEIRPCGEGDGFELVWTTTDGRTLIERSGDAEELRRRRRFLEERLRLDGWVRAGRTTPPLMPLVPRIPDWRPRKSIEPHPLRGILCPPSPGGIAYGEAWEKEDEAGREAEGSAETQGSEENSKGQKDSA